MVESPSKAMLGWFDSGVGLVILYASVDLQVNGSLSKSSDCCLADGNVSGDRWVLPPDAGGAAICPARSFLSTALYAVRIPPPFPFDGPSDGKASSLSRVCEVSVDRAAWEREDPMRVRVKRRRRRWQRRMHLPPGARLRSLIYFDGVGGVIFCVERFRLL